MALILNLETATNVCSVALSRNGEILSLHEETEGRSHASLLTTLMNRCMESAGYNFSNLDAVAVSKGPGSFTGLRIGVATAKGLCFALDKPLIAVNTLQSLAACYKFKYPLKSDMLLCPMIDARRMEVYTALFNFDLTFARETSATILDSNSFKETLNGHNIAFFGDGMAKFEALIDRQNNAHFHSEILPSAVGMLAFSENSYKSSNFESLAYFEPYYLKDFYTPKQPGKRIVRQ